MGLATATDRCSTSQTKESPDPLARIIDSACMLFSERGYHRTSTQEIADRAGVTKGALFYHARYKDEALLQIHRNYFGNLQTSIAAVPSEGQEPAVVLADLILTYVSVNTRERDAVAVVSEERKYLPEHAHEEISAMKGIVHLSIERIVREGMWLGAFATEDAHVTTMIVVGMINSVHRWLKPKTGLDAEAVSRQIASLILYGII
jgi:AcrR family transcriptional regulator